MTTKHMIPVMFRWGGEPDGEVTAIFPTMPYRAGSDDVTAYAHVGQHGCASWAWIAAETRAATPEEYASLLAELARIYSDCDLMVVE